MNATAVATQPPPDPVAALTAHRAALAEIDRTIAPLRSDLELERSVIETHDVEQGELDELVARRDREITSAETEEGMIAANRKMRTEIENKKAIVTGWRGRADEATKRSQHLQQQIGQLQAQRQELAVQTPFFEHALLVDQAARPLTRHNELMTELRRLEAQMLAKARQADEFSEAYETQHGARPAVMAPITPALFEMLQNVHASRLHAFTTAVRPLMGLVDHTR